MKRNIYWHYDAITRLLHWIIALLLIGLVCVGFYMTSIEHDPNSAWYFNMHKSFGLIAALLIFIRIIWRSTHKPAALPASIPHWQAIISRSIHLFLYACMLIMPMSGFIGASLGKYGVVFFGTPLPTWISQNLALSKQLFTLHGLIAWVLVGLVVLHVLAGMKHLLINKDGVFQRMWF